MALMFIMNTRNDGNEEAEILTIDTVMKKQKYSQ